MFGREHFAAQSAYKFMIFLSQIVHLNSSRTVSCLSSVQTGVLFGARKDILSFLGGKNINNNAKACTYNLDMTHM